MSSEVGSRRVGLRDAGAWSRFVGFGTLASLPLMAACAPATAARSDPSPRAPCTLHCAQAGTTGSAGEGSSNPPIAGGAAGSRAIAATAGVASTPPIAATARAGSAAPAVNVTMSNAPAVAGASPPVSAAPTAPSDPGVPTDPSVGCEGETMPPVAGDYSANGPLGSMVVNNTGPDGMYTVYRPAMLGANGFKHPVATWGNGITTDPTFYPGLLGAVASHGFVVIASNSTTVTSDLMVAGLDWMIKQNDTAGDYQGKLKITCLVTIGYSLGGGGSVGAGAHANVVATASMHGVSGASNLLRAPLLLTTAETDTVCTPAAMVTPTFDLSAVQTF